MARDLKGAGWALWKSGERISARQRAKLDWIERTDRPLYQAYLLKEHLRLVFQLPFEAALDLLEAWLLWAASSLLQRSGDAQLRRSQASTAGTRRLMPGAPEDVGYRRARGADERPRP